MNKKLRDKLRFEVRRNDEFGWTDVEATLTIKQVFTITDSLAMASADPGALTDLVLETLQESIAEELRTLLKEDAA